MSYQAKTYLDTNMLYSRLKELEAAYPEFAKLEIIGYSLLDKPIYLLTIGQTAKDGVERPSIWLDGGTHAEELAGVAACLFIAEDWLQKCSQGESWFLKNTAYIAPCISPDGMDAVLSGLQGNIRSSLRPNPHEGNGWVEKDMDEDGKIGWLRWKHPAGSFVAEPHSPFYMRPRTLDDKPEAAFFLVREGEFENWDGHQIQQNAFSFPVDMNRNFPGNWLPTGMFGMGTGAYSLSEPESRAIVDAFAKKPFIGGALTFHTFSGAILGQPYRQNTPLSKKDIDVMRSLGEGMVAGTDDAYLKVYPDFSYDKSQPISGVWADTIATTFGKPGYTVELWNPYRPAGVEVKDYVKMFMDGDDKSWQQVIDYWCQQDKSFKPWHSFDHPQLGKVEAACLDLLRTVRNPPEQFLKEECKKALLYANRMRQSLPKIKVEVEKSEAGGKTKIDLHLSNEGFLSTSGLDIGETLRHTPQVKATLHSDQPLPRETHCLQIGEHMAGWSESQIGVFKLPPYNMLPRKPFQQSFGWIVDKDHLPVKIKWQAGLGGYGEVNID